ncbi:gephyrin-like molybdotransferase Glp [Maricaulis sp.]|uniref:molybdopterin molybdotransferase MoeA n=1 Tax=Maricaulis sp. TaxID=1486257 RepID=UPI002B272875|nr:gephyrin-like molybdotransferase Glp [Maricaulis sp.]
MISLDTALDILRARLRPLDAETVPLASGAGRTLAENVTAHRTQPPFDASAMDGYAVRASDLCGGETRLTLSGEAAAGHASSRALHAGEAMRISTGAPVPAGADQVVIQENTRVLGNEVWLTDVTKPGKNIRVAGTDFTAGAVLLTAGDRITPAALSLAASSGATDFSVTRRPRVAILSTGDELVEPGDATRPDQIINSLAPAIAAMASSWGGDPVYLGIARDDPADVRDKLGRLGSADLLVTIGGASVGDHDHLRAVFGEMGGQLAFEKIAVKPGKPTWFGQLGDTFTLGLPGNPVSAMVMARLCLKTALTCLLGGQDESLFAPARLGVELPANGARETFVRARLDTASGRVAPLTNQDSSAASALVASNCLIRRLANAPAAGRGDRTQILLLDHP